MDINVKPKSLSGRIRAISSKSDAHRAIICAALADRPTEIFISEISKDIKATLLCVQNMGAKVSVKDKIYTITPILEVAEKPIINCGESGSTLRFLLPVAAYLCKNPTFSGEGRLPKRPMDTIIDLLIEKGVEFSGRTLPFSTKGTFSAGKYTLMGNISSQFISGLLFVLPLLQGDSKIELLSPLESSAYVDMTIDTLSRFSIRIIKTENGFIIPGNQKYISSGKYIVEGDWSNSAFMLVSGALGEEISVFGLDVNSNQSDKNIIDILNMAGAEVNVSQNEISVRKSQLKPFWVDVSECPDLFPVLSILALGADGESRLYNAKRLRFKESDRIEAVKNMITALGAIAVDTEDSLTVFGNGKVFGGIVDSVNDHRIAMSAFVASCISQNDIVVKGAECMKKSYPDFVSDFNLLGGDFSVISDRQKD